MVYSYSTDHKDCYSVLFLFAVTSGEVRVYATLDQKQTKKRL